MSMAAEAKTRTLIVDDEAPARVRLRQLLKGEPDFSVVGECSNGTQAVDSIEREKPELVFLDVQMPRLNGLQVCEEIIKRNLPLPVVIFVTAYDTYALKAFEVHAVDYLLKPFDQDRFAQALQHARRQLAHLKRENVESRLAAVLQDLAPGSRNSGRIIFKENGRIIFVETESIHWVEADGNYVRVHANDGAHYIRETLASLESQLPTGRFMRISRSIIVNLDRVKELQPLFYGDYAVILKDGARMSMSRTYRDRLDTLVQRPRGGSRQA